MCDLDLHYNLASSTPSDINEHIVTLYTYAKECDSIVEMGVRDVVSSWGFVKGLADGAKNNPKVFIGVDLHRSRNVDKLISVCAANNIEYKFILCNSATVDLPETDLLFIDTWHCYGHLKRELNKHAASVKKWIIMHDTTVDASTSESVRSGWNISKQAKDNGYSENEVKEGVWKAIEEFLEVNSAQWSLEHRFMNNNGLTILGRGSAARLGPLTDNIINMHNA